MYKKIHKIILSLFAGILFFVVGHESATAQTKEVEVLHWWTSGGEASALKVLKSIVEGKGIVWKDLPIAGGGGEQAMTVLKARIASNNPPTAAQALGFDITSLAKENLLGNLNSIAAKENWDTVIPKAIQGFSKYGGKWVSSPVNVHSTNWVWANKKVLDKVGITKLPNNWTEFMAMADKIKAAGILPFAHGGQAWQDATLFDSVLITSGGISFYKKVVFDLDINAIKSSTMVRAFDRMSQLRALVDDNFSGRDWNLASAMVIEGKAAFQIMGDWAKGEFLSAGLVPNKDFLCFRVPGSQAAVTYNSDQFMMIKVGADKRAAQEVLASSVMSPDFQIAFNVVKGSVPARTDISDAKFDACGKKAMKQLASANERGALLGSLAHGYGAPSAVKNAFFDVVTDHFNGGYSSSREAANALAEAIEEFK